MYLKTQVKNLNSELVIGEKIRETEVCQKSLF